MQRKHFLRVIILIDFFRKHYSHCLGQLNKDMEHELACEPEDNWRCEL